MPLPIAFVDCETTHLDAEIGEVWEVAVILRTPMDDPRPDTEYVWQFAVDLEHADPEALRIGRYGQRNVIGTSCDCPAAFTEPDSITCMTRAEAVQALVAVLSGAVIVGSNPAFDDRFLRKLLGPGSAQWHYRPYDIVQLAAAKVGAQAAGPLPWRAHVLSRAVGVEPPSEDAAHTALGDARWARDVYDAVMTPETIPVSWEGRARHAIGLYTQTAIELEGAQRQLKQARDVARRLVAHSVGFQDVLDDSDRDPWAKTVGADITALWSLLGDPSPAVMTDVTSVCTCTVGEPCGCDSMEPDDGQDDASTPRGGNS